jgi:uncharacterized membrane protein
MKLEDTWKNIDKESTGIKAEMILQAMKAKKDDVLTKLQRKVTAKIAFIVSFIIMYTVLLLFVNDWFVRSLFGVILLMHIAALVYFISEYKKLKQLIPMDGNIRDTLTNYKKRIRTVIRTEEIGGIFLYPLAITAGFFFSMSMKEDWNLAAIFADTKLVVIWLTTAILFTPIGHWMARKLNKKAFGSQLQKLEGLIEEMNAYNSSKSAI